MLPSACYRFLILAIIGLGTPLLASSATDSDVGMAGRMTLLILQLGVIIVVARVCGELFERYLHQPAVLGELFAGMLIGPYALGPLIAIDGRPLFIPLEGNALPVSPELYGMASLASVVLMFVVGLETDFRQIVRHATSGVAVGIGGVIGSFLGGNLITCWLLGKSFFSIEALFMGTISTATSVGITARVLADKKKLDSPEGTTILAGAVVDDVLGIIVLALVGGIAAVETGDGDGIDWLAIGTIALRAAGFWLVATIVGVLASRHIARGLHWFGRTGSITALGLGLALLLAGIAESYGLAMIIGAYIMGLALSKEKISHELERRMTPLYACLVPIFFAVMGMLVDFSAIGTALVFGAVFTLVAILSKVLGSSLPCLLGEFNRLGAARIGIGMLPRGEVALIIAGVGMAQGYIGRDMFGVAIMMTLVTTAIAPPLLIRLFTIDKPGLREEPAHLAREEPEKLITLGPIPWRGHDLLMRSIRIVFGEAGFTLRQVRTDRNLYHLSGTLGGVTCWVQLANYQNRIELKTAAHHHSAVRMLFDRAHEDAIDKLAALVIEEEDLPSRSFRANLLEKP